MLNMMLPYSIIVSKITSINFPLNDIPVLFENASEMKIWQTTTWANST